MVPRDARYQREYAHELLAIAEADLESAFLLATVERKRWENVYLLAQQSLEKALKAVLCWHSELVPLVHDIGILVTKIAVFAKPPFGYNLNNLSEYATIRRYLESKEEYTSHEVVEILKQVKKAVEWCKQQLASAATHADNS